MEIIKASDGMVLTNGTIYAKEIRLGDWDDKSNYLEITYEEYENLTKTEAEVMF